MSGTRRDTLYGSFFLKKLMCRSVASKIAGKLNKIGSERIRKLGFLSDPVWSLEIDKDNIKCVQKLRETV